MAEERNTKTSKPSDVWTRLASAMVLVPIALTCVWYGGWLLSAFAALCAGLMAFEWARMAKSRVGLLMIVGAVAANLLHPVDPRWALIGLVGAGVIAMALEQRDGLKSTALLGTLYAGGLPLALQALRAIPDNQTGLYVAMGVMLLSWSSDTSAYFVGRTFGGPLLAPKDSPNKTWSGAIGAVVGSVLTGIAFAYFVNGPLLIWAMLGICVSVAAQFGDLFESQVKRRHGVKDTSGFLPGHGGVMDRLDGFGTACVAMVAVTKAAPVLTAMLVGHP
ncbi:MAG: phosphatidate cytidylyltransferase [Hyphomonadaceae bacterium]